MPNDFWTDWLNEPAQRAAAYGAYRPKTGSLNFLDYWKGRESNVHDEYVGQLGSMARAGQPPSLSLTDYLAQFPFLQNWLQLGPQQRGVNQQRYAPRTQWRV